MVQNLNSKKWFFAFFEGIQFLAFLANRHKNLENGKTFSSLFKYLPNTVCSCHVTYAFQSESTLYGCLNVKELLARSSRKIWSLSDCNWTRTQNHLVCKRTLNHLAKWLSVLLRTDSAFEYSCNLPNIFSQNFAVRKSIKRKFISVLFSSYFFHYVNGRYTITAQKMKFSIKNFFSNSLMLLLSGVKLKSSILTCFSYVIL